MSKTAERCCARDDLPQLCVRRIAFDPEGHANPLEAVAGLARKAECTLHVHVALECRLHLGQPDAAGGGDVGERGGQAGGECVE